METFILRAFDVERMKLIEVAHEAETAEKLIARYARHDWLRDVTAEPALPIVERQLRELVEHVSTNSHESAIRERLNACVEHAVRAGYNSSKSLLRCLERFDARKGGRYVFEGIDWCPMSLNFVFVGMHGGMNLCRSDNTWSLNT